MARSKRATKSTVPNKDSLNKQGKLSKGFDETLEEEVKKMALKYQVSRHHNRVDNKVANGIGGDENDIFEEDYMSDYGLSRSEVLKESKKSTKSPEGNTFLRKVSNSVEYKSNIKKLK